MTHTVRSSSQILTVAGLLGALVLAVPAGADAQTVQGYTCADSHQSGASTASISLTDPPASITAGQSLSLQAGLTVTLPQSFDLAAKATLISQVGLSTTTFGLQMQIGSTTEVVPASIVVGQLQTLGFSGEAVTGALTFPAVNIPSTAKGDVTISMPTAAQYPNSATATPAEVVFNAVLSQENYIGTPSTANVACYDASTPAPAAQVIAQIPIQADAKATATATASTGTKTTTTSTQPKTTTTATQSKTTKSQSTKSAQTSKPTPASTPASGLSTGAPAAASQSATELPAAGTPTASGGGAATTAAAASPPSDTATTSGVSGTQASTAATVTPASVTIPPRTVGKGTFIPTWELILMGSVFPIAAVGYAWHMRRTLAAARTDLEQHDGPTGNPSDGSAPPETDAASTRQTSSFATQESRTRT